MFEIPSGGSKEVTVGRRGFLALREVTLIVFAVLIAIGLESMWQGRQDRAEEADLLGALHEEMEANSRELERWITLHEMVDLSATELLRLSRAASPGTFISVHDTLLSDIIRTPTYQPQLSVLEAALNSGTIQLLRNLQLRWDLEGWPRGLEEAQEEELKALQFVESQLLPYLFGAVDLEPAQTSLLEFVEAHSAGMPIPARTDSSSNLRIEPLFLNLLARRSFYAGFAIAELRVIQASTEEIRATIQEELR